MYRNVLLSDYWCSYLSFKLYVAIYKRVRLSVFLLHFRKYLVKISADSTAQICMKLVVTRCLKSSIKCLSYSELLSLSDPGTRTVQTVSQQTCGNDVHKHVIVTRDGRKDDAIV